jgi:hypothetical protein
MIDKVSIPRIVPAFTARSTDGQECPSRDEIARLAYHFYETRGRLDGHDLDDWLSAEQELTRKEHQS